MIVQGPFFEELAAGQVFMAAPAVTLTTGHAAVHQAIAGDRLRLPLDDRLALAVTGVAPVAHPALVWDVAIGQSTLATQQVRANLFYRGLVFRRFPAIGDTLSTTTEVVGLRQNRKREGRPPTGLAVLRVRTTDQLGRPVLGFWRCAMLPLADPGLDTGRHDDLDAIGTQPGADDFAVPVGSWRLAAFASRVPGGRHFAGIEPGACWRVASADVVTSAPELARLTLNIAAVHHDEAAAGGRRLVYGGHTIALALAQLSRAIPDVVTVTGWESCDHTGPVHEGDSLTSTITATATRPLAAGGGLAWLRVEVSARSGDGAGPRPVLLWRCVAVLA